MNTKAVIEHFFVQERTRQKKRILLVWAVVILTDICVLFAYLEGVEVVRILQYLTVPLAISLITMLVSSRQAKTLQRRAGTVGILSNNTTPHLATESSTRIY